MITTINLTKRFKDIEAVKNLNLKIKKGEFFVFLGPNAAGKTTTIKLLTGLLRPTEGKVYISDLDIHKDYLQAKSLIGYIPDYPFLYERLTAQEFIEFIGNIYGIESKLLKNKMEYLFELFELKELKDNLILEYSQGMRQRLLYVSVFIHEPKVLIIDEPLVGLDPQASHLLKKLLKQKSQEGTTIFISTHLLSIAEELADRVGIIFKGRLLDIGTVSELSKKAGAKNLEDLYLNMVNKDLKTLKWNN